MGEFKPQEKTMGKNTQKLGNVLAKRMAKTVNASVTTTIELGTINSNMSLRTDSLRASIPKGDYMVNLSLTSDSYRTGAAEGHNHALPSELRALKAGDRVLVAWCGFEPVVIAIVVSS